MAPLPLPNLDEIAKTWSTLFNRDVTHRPYTPMEIGPSCGAVISLLDEQSRVRYLLAFDWQLAHILVGALQLVTPQRVKAAVNQTEVPKDFAENIIEVVNIGRAAINGEGRTHIQIGSTAIHGDGQLTNPFWSTVLDQIPGCVAYRSDCAIRVVGYGTGRMTVLSLKELNDSPIGF